MGTSDAELMALRRMQIKDKEKELAESKAKRDEIRARIAARKAKEEQKETKR